MSKFDKFLEPQTVEKKKSRKVEKSTFKEATEKRKNSGRTVSVKISEEASEKVKLLKMATGKSQTAIMEQALTQYFEEQALTNDKIKAFQTLLNDFKPVDQEQMSIDDYL